MTVAERTGRANASISGQAAYVPPTTTLRSDALLVSRSSQPDSWDGRIDDLLKIRTLEDGWDGAGASAPGTELVDSALLLARNFRDRGYDAPSRIVAGVNGTVLFEWQDDGVYEELEVTAPFQAEMMRVVPGRPAEHWTITGG
jgi:hypothetical protein